ncbi:hypothetical protein GDO78_020329 [Eleutherodactylus coqui]|uniref:Uncharacterized protein n=1 Tax=Eleutherodactylus coqui TaxID=57060 RepID=A0A8J6BK02_ELECQ|nr:hypothetical protein GDO78_020329 [Eleutherodactylus coqui]
MGFRDCASSAPLLSFLLCCQHPPAFSPLCGAAGNISLVGFGSKSLSCYSSLLTTIFLPSPCSAVGVILRMGLRGFTASLMLPFSALLPQFSLCVGGEGDRGKPAYPVLIAGNPQRLLPP